MPLRQFEHLLSVVDCGSINQAARKLFMSQQALRASINSLEKKLGFALLRRSKTGVTLTPRGESVIGDMRAMAATARTWKRLAEWDDGARATVRVAATTTLMNVILAGLVVRAQKQYPNLTLELYETRLQDMLPGLGRRDMIGLIGSLPPQEERSFRQLAASAGRELEMLDPDPYQVVVHAGHPLARGASLRLKQLGRFVAAMYPEEERRFFYREIYRHFSPHMPFFYMTSQENILDLVERDRGVAAVFPRSTVRGRPRYASTLRSLPVADFPMPGGICLICSPRERLSPAERLVIGLIRNAVRDAAA